MKLLYLIIVLLNFEGCNTTNPAFTFLGIMLGAIGAAGLFVYLFFSWLNKCEKGMEEEL